jgi:hypothetical protein
MYFWCVQLRSDARHVRWHPAYVKPELAVTEKSPPLPAGICVGAVEEARHLSNVGIELLYSMYKLMYIDMLWLLKYTGDIVLFLLGHVDGKHGEQVKHHAIVK